MPYARARSGRVIPSHITSLTWNIEYWMSEGRVGEQYVPCITYALFNFSPLLWFRTVNFSRSFSINICALTSTLLFYFVHSTMRCWFGRRKFQALPNIRNKDLRNAMCKWDIIYGMYVPKNKHVYWYPYITRLIGSMSLPAFKLSKCPTRNARKSHSQTNNGTDRYPCRSRHVVTR